jgi:chromosome segregation ATPase
LIDQVRDIRIERDDLADQTKHIRIGCDGLQKQVALQESDFCDTLNESDHQVTDIDDKCQSYASHVSRLRTEVSQLRTRVPGLEADSHQDAASIRELQSSHSKQVRKFNNEIRNLRSQLKALQGRYWKLTSIKVKAVTRSVALNLKVKELDEWLDEILTSNEMLLAEAVLHVKAHEDLISKLNEAGETLGETTKKIVALRAS